MLGCGQYDTNVSVIVLALLIGLILPYELDMMILFILIFGVLHVLRQCNACVRNAQKWGSNAQKWGSNAQKWGSNSF